MTDPVPEKTADQLERERKEEQAAIRRTVETKFGQYGYCVMPEDAQPPILDVVTRRALAEWMAEMNAKRELRKVKVEPRMRVLLDGPPGCGKTTLAHHVAARMGVPMVVVTAHSINSKWVGEGARNIGDLFKQARKMPSGVALFFDEFDAIARNRSGDRGAHSEAQGVTIALLAEMDRHDGMLFAATNVPDGIDPAVQRRFQLRIDIGLPGDVERAAIIRLYMQPFVLDDDLVHALQRELANASPALIKDMCESIKRGMVLGPRLQLDTSLGGLVRRAVTTIKPHESATIPKLWGGVAEGIERLDTAAEGHWPPVLPAG